MCFLVLAGKNATQNGFAIGGHNDDLHGNTAARYEIVSRQKHAEGETLTLLTPPGIGDDDDGRPGTIEIPQPEETYRAFMLATFRGYIAGDTSAVNEHGVSVVGGLNLLMDRNDRAEDCDPVVRKGLAGGARYVALLQSRTARECVVKLGELLTRHGAVFPSCVGIVDPNEAWYFEIGGGSTWLAVRVPDDSCLIQSNGYRIGEIDFDDRDNLIHSPELPDFLRAKGLWNPEKGAFHWARAFGGRLSGAPATKHYNSRRIWAALRVLCPQEKLDPEAIEHPLFLRPQKKLTARDVMEVLRNAFEGTPYVAFPEKGKYGAERPVGVPSCIHSAVVETNGQRPADVGTVLWGCVGSPLTSPYTPHYPCVDSIPEPFTQGDLSCDSHSAFWRLRALTNLVVDDFPSRGAIVRDRWRNFEDDMLRMREAIEESAAILYRENPEKAASLLTSFSNSLDCMTLNIAGELERELQTAIAGNLYKCFAKPGLEW